MSGLHWLVAQGHAAGARPQATLHLHLLFHLFHLFHLFLLLLHLFQPYHANQSESSLSSQIPIRTFLAPLAPLPILKLPTDHAAMFWNIGWKTVHLQQKSDTGAAQEAKKLQYYYLLKESISKLTICCGFVDCRYVNCGYVDILICGYVEHP